MFVPSIDWKEEISNILSLGSQDKTLREIGEYYGVSRQRIKQVCQRYGILPTAIGKGAKRAKREAAFKQKWGDKNDSSLYGIQRSKYRTKKANAKRLGIPFTVAFGDLSWPVYCPILGLEIDYFAENRSENSCTFDRKNPKEGYTPENTFIISWRANRIKNDGTAKEHQLIIEWMSTP